MEINTAIENAVAPVEPNRRSETSEAMRAVPSDRMRVAPER